jgi:K+-sensing histidine kinase KdpD
VASSLIDLVQRCERLPSSPIVDDACGLLRYHHRMLDETLHFAYDVSAILDRRAARYFSARLGAPAERLRRLRDLTAGYVGDPPRHPGGTGDGTVLPDQLSHSLRTPLTSIVGNASSLLQPDVDWDRAAQQRLLRLIVNDSARLSRNIDNVLRLASLASGTLQPAFDWCQLADIVRAAVAGAAASLSPGTPIEVVVDLDRMPDNPIWADHSLLTLALVNVIDNAFRHNQAGTPVHIGARVDATAVAVTVADHGRGLARRAAVEVTRAATSGTLPTSIGTGIAATIGLVGAQGGHVEFSDNGPGTRCVLELPASPPCS